MNNINKITDRILSDARQEIGALEAETKARCEQIEADGKAAAQDAYWQQFKKGTANAALRLERLGSMAQLEAKKQVLREKQTLIGEAFDRAVELMRTLPDAEYTKLGAYLTADAAVTGNEKVILSAADREKFGPAVVEKANAVRAGRNQPAGLTLAEETRPISGGAILSDGQVEMNCSLDVLVNAGKGELAGEVAKILFD